MGHAVLLLHVIAGYVLVVIAAGAAIFGLSRRSHLRLGGSARSDKVFTQLVAVTQTLIVGCGFFGLMALAQPGSPRDHLHITVYGPFMLAAVIGAYSYRTDDPRWNVTVFAVACLFVAGLGVRALTTG